MRCGLEGREATGSPSPQCAGEAGGGGVKGSRHEGTEGRHWAARQGGEQRRFSAAEDILTFVF